MIRPVTRRELLLGSMVTFVAGCASSPRVGPTGDADHRSDAGATTALAAIEARTGGRLGVFALDTGTGRELAHRPDERFAMCSTFKWLLAAAVLAQVDRAELSLDEQVPYGSGDLLEHAPVAREHLAEGSLSVDALARAAVTVSDNTAANLLLAKVGGPSGVTGFARSLGDSVTRLDRAEPDSTRTRTRTRAIPRLRAPW